MGAVTHRNLVCIIKGALSGHLDLVFTLFGMGSGIAKV